MKRLELGVGGMSCAACSARVERALKGVGGVESASVNLAASFIFTGENSFALTLLNTNANTNTHMPALIRNMSSGLTARHIFPAVLFPFPLCRFLSFVPRSTLRYLSV